MRATVLVMVDLSGTLVFGLARSEIRPRGYSAELSLDNIGILSSDGIGTFREPRILTKTLPPRQAGLHVSFPDCNLWQPRLAVMYGGVTECTYPVR